MSKLNGIFVRMQYVVMNSSLLQEKYRHTDPWVNVGELSEDRQFLFESMCVILTLHTDI